jgi:hypothetical protein
MSKTTNTLQEFIQNPSDFSSVNLANKNITNDDCAKLAAALKGNNTVTQVYLSGNQIGDAGAAEDSQDNLPKANEYFNRALHYLDTKKSMLITEASGSLFQMLYVGTKKRDSDLISKVKTRYTESIDIQKEVLFEFVRTGDKASIGFLLSQGIDINITNASKVTALSIACESNNFDMVSFLLSKNIEFDTTSIIGLKPFQAAAIRIAHEDGDVRILEALLKKYRDTATDLSDEILQDVDCRLQHGPSYMQETYRCLVGEVLHKELVDSTGGTEDWASYSDWWN